MPAAGDDAHRGADGEERRECEDERRRRRPSVPVVEQERDQRHDRADGERHERGRSRAPRRAELVGIEAQLLADLRVERLLRIAIRLVGDRLALRAAAGPWRGRSAVSSSRSTSGMTRISSRSMSIWFSNSSRWLCMLMYSPAAIEKAPASRPAMPARTMNWLSACGSAGDAHDQRQVADEAVVGAEDCRAQRARTAATVPRLLVRPRRGVRRR